MKILSFYPTKTFKLVMEFDNNEYRVLDIRKFLQNDQGLLKDICNNVNLFMSAELDEVAGTIRFSNEVDFDSNVLYEASQDLDDLMQGNRKSPKPQIITRFPENYQSKISKENERLLRFLKGNKLD